MLGVRVNKVLHGIMDMFNVRCVSEYFYHFCRLSLVPGRVISICHFYVFRISLMLFSDDWRIAYSYSPKR